MEESIMNLNKKWEKIMDEWIDLSQIVFNRHNQLAKKNYRIHWFLGVPVVIITALTGPSALLGLYGKYQPIAIIIGISSLIAAVLSGLTSFGNFSRKGAEHQELASRCKCLEMELEFRKAFQPKTNEEAEKAFSELKRQFSGIPLIVPIQIKKSVQINNDKLIYNRKSMLMSIEDASEIVEKEFAQLGNVIDLAEYGICVWLFS